MSYRNSPRVEFKKWINEFQVSMNPLDKWFKMEPVLEANSYFDFVGSVDSSSTYNPLTVTSQLSTATAKDVTWRRRKTEVQQSDLHIAVPRQDARILGKEHAVLIGRYKNLFKMAIAREAIKATIRLLTQTYKQNPIMGDLQTTAETDAPFPESSEHMFISQDGTRIDTTNEKFSAAPDIASWYYLTAAMDNARKRGTIAKKGQLNEGTGVERSKNNLVICSNTAFTYFKHTNAAIIGNRELHGVDVYLGAGKLYEFQGYAFLVLPDEYLPSQGTSENVSGTLYGTARTNLRFPYYVTWGRFGPLLTGSTSALGTGVNGITLTQNTTIQNTYPMLVVEPNAFRMKTVEQLKVKPTLYKDFQKSQEKFIFGTMPFEGIRLFDGMVRRIWVTGTTRTGVYDG